MGNPDRIRDLLDSRRNMYGQAWKTSGAIQRLMVNNFAGVFNKIEATDYFYAWTIILNKLVRTLADPHHSDSWEDIAGYAILVAEDLQQKNRAGSRSNVTHQGVEDETP